MTPQETNQKRREAASLVAEDKLTDEAIAEKLGIGRATLARWKKSPAFQKRVTTIVEAYADRALRHGIARQDVRLTKLASRYEKLEQIVEERAQDPEVQEVAGGKTGFVVRNVKGIGKGDAYQVVEVFEVDQGVLKEFRAIEEQVAEELGQKVSKHQLTGKDGGPITMQMIDECLGNDGTAGENSEAG